MKLNMDCVRAVMLCAEEYTDYNHYCYFISYQKNNVNDFLLDDPETPPAYQLELEKTYDNDDPLSIASNPGLLKLFSRKTLIAFPFPALRLMGIDFLKTFGLIRTGKRSKALPKRPALSAQM